MAAYDGLLLDHDGVLVTFGDGDALRRAAREALERTGLADPPADAVETLRVSVSPTALERVADRHDLDPATLWRHRDDSVAAALRAEVRAGRKAPYVDVGLLATLERPVGVVSNNQQRVVEFVLDHYDLAAGVDTVHAREPTVESLSRKKPEPTYLEEAMAALDVENPLYVGDSESDVVAGQRAGLDTAFLRRPHRNGHRLDVEPTYDIAGLDAAVSLLRRGGR
jgi:HAD superfamily hydrolase (TIGR01549 family)